VKKLGTSQAVLQTLQTNWSLSSPAGTAIDWVSTRVETIDWAKTGLNVIIACYNPTSPAQVTRLSSNFWESIEQVAVDIMVKVTGAVGDAVTVRDNCFTEVARILRVFLPAGLQDIYPVRETVKVEGPDVVRVALILNCIIFYGP
jgi:hypothetical protein